MTTLGRLLETMRGQSSLWFKYYCLFLAALLGANVYLRPEHPHFGLDANFGFWALFGFFVGILLVFIMKRFVQPLIIRNEDYYGDI